MAASQAFNGVGTIFRRWSESDEYETIGEITDISGPNKSRDTIEVTSLNSVDGYREFIGSFRDGGTVALKMNFTRSTYDLMNADFESESLQYYEIVLSDTRESSFEFIGLVTELGLAISTGSQVTSDVSIKVSSKITVNDGGSSGLTSSLI